MPASYTQKLNRRERERKEAEARVFKLETQNRIDNLRKTSHLEIIRLFRECVETLSNPVKIRKHEECERLKQAILLWWKNNPKPDDWFQWPSTLAAKGQTNLRYVDAEEYGVFSLFGYRVGKSSSLNWDVRQGILVEIFKTDLPRFWQEDYLEEWDRPHSALRLQKMANVIASSARNMNKRRDADTGVAVREWETDLKFLKEKFYDGVFGFSFPFPALSGVL